MNKEKTIYLIVAVILIAAFMIMSFIDVITFEQAMYGCTTISAIIFGFYQNSQKNKAEKALSRFQSEEEYFGKIAKKLKIPIGELTCPHCGSGVKGTIKSTECVWCEKDMFNG